MDPVVKHAEDAPETGADPFDLLYAHAEREHRAGRTTELREFLAGEIDEPDVESA